MATIAVRPPARAQPAEGARPAVPWGVQSGDVTASSAVIWSAADRPARMVVEWATNERFADARRVVGAAALPESGGTAKTVLDRLPSAQDVFYRVTFVDLRDARSVSAPVVGRLRTAPSDERDVTFAWSGDTVGQGWGINAEWGGLRLYDAVRATAPDFFVHCGDLVYADNPLRAEVPLPGGGVWKNLVTPEKAKVAETLDEFRGQYRYNLMDETLRRFNAEVAQYVQWDDHDVTDNWFPTRILDDARYTEKSCALLAARGQRAMLEWTPIGAADGGRVYRGFRRGPLLDLFLLDMRSYRGPNGDNREATLTDDARILGAGQVAWLKRALAASRATWKVIAADQPLGLVIHHDWRAAAGSEAVAQGDGPPLGRELEIADVLSFIKRRDIDNVVWITADVHYPATHRYEPERAAFTDFTAFHEFVSGPLHAGGFGPNPLDNTFGPRVVFSKPPPRMNTAPSDGHLYFGHVRIDGRTRVMTVRHHDLGGAVLHETRISPSAAPRRRA